MLFFCIYLYRFWSWSGNAIVWQIRLCFASSLLLPTFILVTIWFLGMPSSWNWKSKWVDGHWPIGAVCICLLNSNFDWELKNCFVGRIGGEHMVAKRVVESWKRLKEPSWFHLFHTPPIARTKGIKYNDWSEIRSHSFHQQTLNSIKSNMLIPSLISNKKYRPFQIAFLHSRKSRWSTCPSLFLFQVRWKENSLNSIVNHCQVWSVLFQKMRPSFGSSSNSSTTTATNAAARDRFGKPNASNNILD